MREGLSAVETYDGSSRYTSRFVYQRRVSLLSVLLAPRRKSALSCATDGREARGVQVHACKYGRAVYHGVSALPHKSRDTGPPLISLFNLRVRNNFARHLYEQVVALESGDVLIAL